MTADAKPVDPAAVTSRLVSKAKHRRREEAIKLAAFLALLCLIAYVALAPDKLYSPTARTSLFFLCGVTLALLVGSELGSRFELKLPGMAITLVGASAVAIGTVAALTYLASPEETISAVEVVDENGRAVILSGVDLRITPREGAGDLTYAVRSNTVYVVFPSTVMSAKMEVSYAGGQVYRGPISRSARGRLHVKQTADGKLLAE